MSPTALQQGIKRLYQKEREFSGEAQDLLWKIAEVRATGPAPNAQPPSPVVSGPSVRQRHTPSTAVFSQWATLSLWIVIRLK